MIKKTLFCASILSVGFVSAQSFQLMDYNDVDIANTVHYEYGTASELGQTKFHLENLTGSAKNFGVSVERIYYNGDHVFSCNNLAVCFGTLCYSGLASVSGVQVINSGVGDVVAANTIYTELKLAPSTFCWDDCAIDSATWTVTVYDQNNPTDSVFSTIVWRCGPDPVSVEEITKENVRLNAYPNPAINVLTIGYFIDGEFDKASIDVYDVFGQKVAFKELNSGKGEVELSVENLGSGVYFYSIKVDGQSVRTERVVVR